ncbi:phenylalanine--tRNA ligase subunit alpha [Neorickettsia findlayensis]|uniref:Phenylalanine--tRNA ligase alpha subunit n=1 Tax=Neorickettsia findlayensis TaxID=2686014 RepID=A0A6P1G976_9RICK|nr:phenylalanine--tRNA ligase subunit alpha [Neorickettsia findlayensis]QHD65009.1 phenylalanine--tRNA ligase subunit alpha [Neorickettsia findlayensis]
MTVDSGEVRDRFYSRLGSVFSVEELNRLRFEYLSNKGGLVRNALATLIQQGTRSEQLGEWTSLLKEFNLALARRLEFIREKESNEKLASEAVDVSCPARPFRVGLKHPLIRVIEDTRRILTSLGLEYVEGPEVEDEYHVFDALNTPAHHPSRQMQDSFYLFEADKLLRTHTSSVQIRIMEEREPPFYIFSLGKVYRNDWDATHTPMFHQVEVLCVDVDINMSHMRYCVSFFLDNLFGCAKMRMRPSYFPFTEPSAEIDIRSRDGKWLEVMGCGMVHPNVLRNVGVSPDKYRGFAFGAGLERLAVLNYDIHDLRSLYSNDLRWKVS